jgi:DNA (cytosine-5)-methyltransferase 1
LIGTRQGVRRLMPVECERLQGLPDGHTAWGINEKGERVEMSDSARYRMIGNGVSVPVIEWIAKRTRKMMESML